MKAPEGIESDLGSGEPTTGRTSCECCRIRYDSADLGILEFADYLGNVVVVLACRVCARRHLEGAVN
jgi:hypothetical protein